jgi:hypothetical protein
LSKQLLTAEDKRKEVQAVYQNAKASTDTNSIPEVQRSERIMNMQQRLSELKEKKDCAPRDLHRGMAGS